MSNSIMQTRKCCYVCGTDQNLHMHHVFAGTANRKKSDEDGCWVWLCGPHHNLSINGVHFNKGLDNKIKCDCQKKWQDLNGAEEDFIKRFGRNYLD